MSIDFSRNAKVYDRRHGARMPLDIASALSRAADLRPPASILDLASGTGRVALSLAELGFDVLATDIAADMLEQLKIKAGDLRVRTRTLAPGRLPFDDGAWGAITLARVLYLLPDWKAYLADISRIIKPDGVLLHEWGNGTPTSSWVRYREDLRRRLSALGLRDAFHPGARTEDAVEDHLLALGWIRTAEIASGPGTPMTLGHFMHIVESGEASYLWHVPEAVQARVLPDLRDWAITHLGPLDTPIDLPGDAHWRIYRRDQRTLA